MKNNINLDELFSKAKDAEPVFSIDDAKQLIENKAIANTGKYYNKNISRSTIMNILSAAVVTAVTVGVLTFNTFFEDNKPQISKNEISFDSKLKNEDSNKKDIAYKYENGKVEIKKQDNVKTDFYIDKIDSNINTKSSIDDIIKGINIIELTEVQANNIGIKISKDGDYIEYVKGTNTQKPELVKIYVDWGVGINKINSTDLSNYANIGEPRMITDNLGNKRLSTFNDDENSNLSKLEFMDKDKNLYIQSVSSNDTDKNINVVMGGIDNTYNIGNNSSMNWTTVLDIDSLLTNLNLDEIINNSFSNLDDIKNKLDLPDSLKNRTIEELVPMLSDSTKKYMTSLSKNYDIKLKLDGNISEEIKQKLEGLKYNLKNINIDSLIKSNFQKNQIIISEDEIDSVNAFKFNNAQVKIVKKISNDPKLTIDDLKISSSTIGDELIKLNKLVPVAINIPNAKDRNGKEYKNFRFLLWFEPTNEFVSKLPDNIKTQLQKELNTLNSTKNICETKEVIAGQETFLDVWRACSGALENLTAYPTPVENIVNVKFKLNENRVVTFSIHDLNGRKIQELGKVTLSNGDIDRSFEVRNLESGMYLIVAQTEIGEQAIQRIIVK